MTTVSFSIVVARIEPRMHTFESSPGRRASKYPTTLSRTIGEFWMFSRHWSCWTRPPPEPSDVPSPQQRIGSQTTLSDNLRNQGKECNYEDCVGIPGTEAATRAIRCHDPVRHQTRRRRQGLEPSSEHVVCEVTDPLECARHMRRSLGHAGGFNAGRHELERCWVMAYKGKNFRLNSDGIQAVRPSLSKPAVKSPISVKLRKGHVSQRGHPCVIGFLT